MQNERLAIVDQSVTDALGLSWPESLVFFWTHASRRTVCLRRYLPASQFVCLAICLRRIQRFHVPRTYPYPISLLSMNPLASNQIASPVEILWEDPTSLVVNKPAGILTQGAPGIETLETRLRSYLKLRDGHAGEPYVALPHRIDRPVSGTLLVARNIRATQRFGAQFQSRKIGKSYWAIAEGEVPSTDAGGGKSTWTDYVRKILDQPVAEIVDATADGAKHAVLHYRVIGRFMAATGNPRSFMEVELETGRMHQIRLQFASRGFPLLGDSLYGATSSFGPQVDDSRQKAIALHAREIRFRHPKTGVEVVVKAPPPSFLSSSQSYETTDGWDAISGL
jgi:23S rRNA pseudouridine1911/1915/1917 synthase